MVRDANPGHRATLRQCRPGHRQDGVASEIDPNPDCVIAHVAGSLGLAVLGTDHRRVGAVHPLVSLTSPTVGASGRTIAARTPEVPTSTTRMLPPLPLMTRARVQRVRRGRTCPG